MYIYNVTVKVELERTNEWLHWMKQEHIPKVMETGYFQDYKLCRLLDDAELDGVTFVIQYTCLNLEDFLIYTTEEAPALQKQHIEKFGADAIAFRTIMELL